MYVPLLGKLRDANIETFHYNAYCLYMHVNMCTYELLRNSYLKRVYKYVRVITIENLHLKDISVK